MEMKMARITSYTLTSQRLNQVKYRVEEVYCHTMPLSRSIHCHSVTPARSEDAVVSVSEFVSEGMVLAKRKSHERGNSKTARV